MLCSIFLAGSTTDNALVTMLAVGGNTAREHPRDDGLLKWVGAQQISPVSSALVPMMPLVTIYHVVVTTFSQARDGSDTLIHQITMTSWHW